MSKPNVTRVQSATRWTASVHTLHMSKPNVTRVQSATQWTASVHTLHMSKPNVTRVQSATQWTASVHTLHMSKPNVTRVQSATQWTASVHTLHMSKPNVTRVHSATQWTASVHTLHMSKPNVTRVQGATQWTASVHTLHMSKPNVTRVHSATQWTASVHTLHMSKPNVIRVQSATQWTASVHTSHMSKAVMYAWPREAGALAAGWMILTINAWKPISLENACKFHIPPLKAAYQRTSVGPAIQRSSVPAQFSVPAPRRPLSVAAYQRQAGKAAYQRTSVPAPGGESSVPAYQRRRLAGPLSHRTETFFIFTPIWGRFPFWLIFFRWVETTNQRILLMVQKSCDHQLRLVVCPISKVWPPETNSSALKIGLPKRKRSCFNHPFSGAMLVSGSVYIPGGCLGFLPSTVLPVSTPALTWIFRAKQIYTPENERFFEQKNSPRLEIRKIESESEGIHHRPMTFLVQKPLIFQGDCTT